MTTKLIGEYMSKIDISVTRKDHVNVGDFSHINPNVTLTLKDVDLDKSQQAYKLLSELCFTMHTEEFIKSVNEMEDLIKMNDVIKLYKNEIEKNVDLENERNKIFNELKQLTESD